MNDPYIRKGLVDRIIDGDTLCILCDLGFHVYSLQTVRLAGINAPEIVGKSKPDGILAKAYLSELLPLRQAVTMVSFQPRSTDKYGRFLAMVYKDNLLINDAMVEAGHAIATPGY